MAGGRSVLGVVVAAALLTVGCNPAAQDEPGAASASSSGFSTQLSGTLRTGGFNPSDEVARSRSDLATRAVSPVKVSMDTTEFDAQKFAAQAASGQVPDLLSVDRTVVGTLADKGLIRPLEQCFSLHGVRPAQQYYPAAIKDVTYDTHIYGVPQSFQTSMLIGNKRVMAKAGVTPAQLDTSRPDALVGIARKMYHASNGRPDVLGLDLDLPGSSAMWLKVFGGAPMDDEGRPTLDDSKNVQALTWMKKVMDAQGGYASIKSFKDSMDVFGDQNQYVTDEVGAQTWGQWYANVLSNTQDRVSPVGVPVKSVSGQSIGFAGGTALVVPKGSRNPSAACSWAIKATSVDAWVAAGRARAQKVKAEGAINTGLFTASPPADRAVRRQFVKSSGNADFDQLVNASYTTLENPVSFGGSAAGKAISDALSNAVSVSLAGEKTPAQALKDAQADATRAWQQTAVGKHA